MWVDASRNRVPEPIEFDPESGIEWDGYEIVDTLVKMLRNGPVFEPHSHRATYILLDE